MKDFNYWKKLYESEKLEEFSTNKIGLLWLKIKSIMRVEMLKSFLESNNYVLKETSLNKQFVELFDFLSENIQHSNQVLDKFIVTV